MVKSMFAGVAGLRTHQSKMDVIGNNIANVNTWGFKSASMSFKDTMYQNASAGSAGNTDTGGYGGTNANQIGYGVTTGLISYDFTKGSPSPTSRNLDCMIDGTGFFMVGPMINGGELQLGDKDVLKSSGLYLSRVGQFDVDNNGYLVDDAGNYVYGFMNTDVKGTANFDTDVLKPLKIPTNGELDVEGNGDDNDPAILSSYKIEKDGTVVATAEGNVNVVIGKIALAGVQNTSGLEKDTGYYYSIGPNAGSVGIYEAGSTQGRILGGYLEMAQVDLATEMTGMITTQRGFQANSKIITVTDQMLEELVNMKR